MLAIAKLRKLHISPRKTNLVASLIRGMNAQKALQVLQYTQKKSAQPISKLLKSAIANYQQQQKDKTSPEQLYIQTVHVGSAGILKRIKPRARGTANHIRKRHSHISITVAPIQTSTTPQPKKTPKKK